MAKYKPGQSGNPNGRPKKDVADLRPLLAKHGKDVLQIVIDAALDGDLVACKIVIDRLYPSIKPTAAKVTVPTGKSLDETGNNIIESTLDGTIAPDIGTQLLSGLASQAKLVESTELLKRIEILEGKK